MDEEPASATWWHGAIAARERQHSPELDCLAREVLRLAGLKLVRPFLVEVEPGIYAHRITRTRSPILSRERRQCRIAPPR